VLHWDITQQLIALLGGVVCCIGTLHSSWLHCWWSCVLHWDITQQLIALLGGGVCCIGTLHSSWLHCWVVLCVALGRYTAVYFSMGCYILHGVSPRHLLLCVLQLYVWGVFLVFHLFTKVVIRYSCSGNFIWYCNYGCLHCTGRSVTPVKIIAPVWYRSVRHHTVSVCHLLRIQIMKRKKFVDIYSDDRELWWDSNRCAWSRLVNFPDNFTFI
jgi:hypothetical protein